MPSTLASPCLKRFAMASGRVSSVPAAGVPVDVRQQVLDEQLAAQALAEELDVGADDRTEVQQQRRVHLGQAGDEFGQALGRNGWCVAAYALRPGGRSLGPLGAPLEDV